VRLHVAAKRFLCATEPGYIERLSSASQATLSVQGGPMSASEVCAFALLPYARNAVALRRWDEAVKGSSGDGGSVCALRDDTAQPAQHIAATGLGARAYGIDRFAEPTFPASAVELTSTDAMGV
jgi:hypothetical protein